MDECFLFYYSGRRKNVTKSNVGTRYIVLCKCVLHIKSNGKLLIVVSAIALRNIPQNKIKKYKYWGHCMYLCKLRGLYMSLGNGMITVEIMLFLPEIALVFFWLIDRWDSYESIFFSPDDVWPLENQWKKSTKWIPWKANRPTHPNKIMSKMFKAN